MRLELETRRFYIGRDYSEAVEGCGGLPVHIPLIPNADYLNEMVAGLDGILLPGSDTDPDPYRYGEEPHPRLKKVIPEKDETDLLVLAAAEERNIPVLGICFGMQILNVSRGGSLIQDIGSQVNSPLKHDQGLPLERNSHQLRIEDGSILARLAGKGSDGLENVKVNSHHHQAVKVVGRDLRAVASTSDGVIEAVEDTRDGRFVVGIQWHPELSWKKDSLSNSIFNTFVERCTDI
jgi:putative glutamine amidotransferase